MARFNKHGIATIPKVRNFVYRGVSNITDMLTYARLHSQWASPQTLQRYYNSRQYDRLNDALHGNQNVNRLINDAQRQHHANVTNGEI